ncbi:hypothetical protein [Paraburkholderia sp. BL10I2N1]|uniref:hypothetical protein n=1 Tax=Paraburkholderia sp. BL10I2N1 TaxID=1938796 RepID=UPI00105C1B87|nr:hypothetical protein [Paraburkholderia sp. BL10I2N1]TDN69089.1 hypothetical protein B0G77_2458 [Paraburkholderia sp. BL10I2N1]
MADEIDRFVLSYTVDVKDGVSRLEKLKEKMNGVQKGAKESSSGLKDFAANATSELGKLIPGLDAVSAAVRTMGAEFAVAGTALGALAIGVKAVMDLRNQYNAQRSAGMQLGVSSFRLEDYQRKMVRAGNGYVTRESAAEGIKAFSDMSNAAYTDPSRLGKEARVMRMLGVDVGARGAAPTGLNSELSQLAMGLQGKSAGDVQGIAKATGMNQDWLLTIQRLGPSIGKITDLTSEEIEKRKQAEESLSKYNDSVAQLTLKYNEASVALGSLFLPKFTEFVKLLSDAAGFVPKGINDLKAQGVVGKITHTDVQPSKAPGVVGWVRRLLGIADPVDDTKKLSADAQQKKQEQKKEQDKRDKAVDEMDSSNKQGLQTANQMALAVNMFAGAVQSFSSAISVQQAWAAWAGEIGKANGLSGSSNAALPGTNAASSGARGLRNNNPGNIEYGAFAKANGATGSDGRFAFFPSMAAGAAAQSTLLDQNYFAKGLNTPRKIIGKYAPASENNQAAYLSFLQSRGFDPDKAITDRAGFKSAQMAYESGYGSGHGIGESRAKMNTRSVQQSVADYLHVPLDQIQRGGVTKGDAGWAARQIQAGMSNNIYDLKRQLSVAGLPQQTYAKLQYELRDQSRGLDMMRQYSGDVMGRQREGGQKLTVGEMPIVINVNGAQDPKLVSQEVNNALRKAITDIAVMSANGIKG